MKWLLLAIFAIYSWSTPGLYLFAHWISPTINGVELALAQCLRLLIVAASLQIMLTYLDKHAIVSALYYLARPFAGLGLVPERVAVRLSVTMDYAESLLEQRISFADLMQNLMQMSDVQEASQSLVLQRIYPWQAGVLGFQILLIVLTVWFGNYLNWN